MAAEHPDARASFESFEGALRQLYAEFTFDFAAPESGVSAETLERVPGSGDGRHAAVHPHLAQRAAGNLGGWQVARCLFLLNALLGAVATEGGTYPNAWNKFVPRPIYTPPHPPTLERADLAARVPARDERAVVPAAALPEGGPRQARRLLHPRLQPGVDQPRRLRLDRGAHQTRAGRAARRADADVERDRVLRRLRPADGARHRAARPALVRDRTTRSGSASASRCCAPRASGSAPLPTPARSTRARSGRRTSSGSSCRGGSIPDGSIGIRQFAESRRKPGDQARPSTSTTATSSRTRCPALPERAAGRGADAARVHAPLRRVRDPARVGALYEERGPDGELEDAAAIGFGRVYTRAPNPPPPTSCRWPRPEPDA